MPELGTDPATIPPHLAQRIAHRFPKLVVRGEQ
jgi:hypothetical protein